MKLKYKSGDLIILGSGKQKGYVVLVVRADPKFLDVKFWDDTWDNVFRIEGEDYEFAIPSRKREIDIANGPPPNELVLAIDRERRWPE
jgi:hypothetical protein